MFWMFMIVVVLLVFFSRGKINSPQINLYKLMKVVRFIYIAVVLFWIVATIALNWNGYRASEYIFESLATLVGIHVFFYVVYRIWAWWEKL